MDNPILEIDDNFDVSKYLQAKWRRETRNFVNHRGFNVPIKVLDISNSLFDLSIFEKLNNNSLKFRNKLK